MYAIRSYYGFFALIAGAFVDGLRELRVDGGAGDLFQDRSPLVGIGLEKGGKVALGKSYNFV